MLGPPPTLAISSRRPMPSLRSWYVHDELRTQTRQAVFDFVEVRGVAPAIRAAHRNQQRSRPNVDH